MINLRKSKRITDQSLIQTNGNADISSDTNSLVLELKSNDKPKNVKKNNLVQDELANETIEENGSKNTRK